MSSLGRERRERGLWSFRFVLLGTVGGALYAVLNRSMDYLNGRGIVARAFVALHDVVDEVIPVLVGGLLGLAIHYWRLRTRIAAEERARADELRARVLHVERDQAVWVVAAATLHELKNPLHALGLLVEELEATPAADEPASADLRARMRAQMERALVPLDGLRALAGGRRRGGAEVPVAEVAERLVRELAPLVGERGVELRLEGTGDLALRADPGFLRIILENLIGNSIDGLRGTGRGHVCVRLGPDAVDVSDDGPGLSEAAVRALFHPLETAKAEGLGLGLSIARALARAMHGDLALASVDGWSTTFRLTLPAASKAA
ncbi:MAG: periplasmic sensor signal transduction histidine kinase [Labilithrix sp.]|nr:periplasmic sensor signal transduction histidine kinase [Labilithrix sp.]